MGCMVINRKRGEGIAIGDGDKRNTVEIVSIDADAVRIRVKSKTRTIVENIIGNRSIQFDNVKLSVAYVGKNHAKLWVKGPSNVTIRRINENGDTEKSKGEKRGGSTQVGH